jgi:hypothetical protein
LLTFGVQQARARLHAGDALRRIQRRASLHHHELPADGAVVVGLPADAAEHAFGRNTASCASGRAGACARFAEAQIELEAVLEEGQRNARQRR